MSETATEYDWRHSRSTLDERAVFGLTAVAMLVTLLPVAAALDRWWVAGIFVLSVMVGVAAERYYSDFREIRDLATARPTATEVLLAAANQLQTSAFLALLALGFFYGVRWALHAIDSVVNVPWNHVAVANIVTVVVLFVPIFGVTMVAAEDMARILYPQTAGIPSGFSAFARKRRRLAVMLGALLGAAVAAFVALTLVDSEFPAKGGALTFLGVVFLISVPLTPEEHEPVQDRPPAETLAAAVNAFGEDRSVEFPRSRKDEIDPLLLDVDLLVLPRDDQGGDALALDIKQRRAGEALDWTVGSALVTASRAMETVIRSGAKVHPVVVLVNAKADDSLREFSRSESVALVELDMSAHDVRVQGDPDGIDLEAASKRLLGLLTGDGVDTVGGPVAQTTERAR
jgi:hypothetical protein